MNEIANQKIDQVADLQQQMKNLRDSKNNVTRSLNRLIEAVKLHRGTQWIKSLDPILKDCLKEG
ncbi:MAG: hypothetical protein HWD61_10805 [Parachlamydiaceae bacterium]|nr:MAG: hypothetical protein HWD61_10805 [Parachlamydiaceae bacterium]